MRFGHILGSCGGGNVLGFVVWTWDCELDCELDMSISFREARESRKSHENQNFNVIGP